VVFASSGLACVLILRYLGSPFGNWLLVVWERGGSRPTLPLTPMIALVGAMLNRHLALFAGIEFLLGVRCSGSSGFAVLISATSVLVLAFLMTSFCRVMVSFRFTISHATSSGFVRFLRPRLRTRS